MKLNYLYAKILHTLNYQKYSIFFFFFLRCMIGYLHVVHLGNNFLESVVQIFESEKEEKKK